MSHACKLVVVFVHYHTEGELERSVQTVREQLEACGFHLPSSSREPDCEILVVDNGSDHPERLRALPVRVLSPGENLGYAGGVNLAVRTCPAERYLLLNPDVTLRAGCLRALLDAQEQGSLICGPRSYWDEELRLVMPPGDPVGRLWEFTAALARRSPVMALSARVRWRQHARAHWSAEAPVTSYTLSGSTLLFDHRAWQRVGAFDEGFKLYFEETDWLQRAKRERVPAAYVPAARVRHAYAQSTKREPQAQLWFEESARRFRRLYYGSLFVRFLEGLAGREPVEENLPRLFGKVDLGEFEGRGVTWIEVSPNRCGFPAVGERVKGALPSEWSFPEELLGEFPDHGMRVVLSDGVGQEVHRFVYG